MFSEKILQNKSLGMCNGLSTIKMKNRSSDLTLNVEKASAEISKLRDSTNLKNNKKLADSNMYLEKYELALWNGVAG